tara:strand:+ start:729 stop:965 length:237 start_codon:yes stop_codon:yes gene_type:complete
MEMETKQVMPKWFDGQIYSTGDVVTNNFTGESIELTAEEVSMYDLIMGAQMLQQYEIMEKGLSWFRRNNAEAYMVLLD